MEELHFCNFCTNIQILWTYSTAGQSFYRNESFNIYKLLFQQIDNPIFNVQIAQSKPLQELFFVNDLNIVYSETPLFLFADP